MQASELTFWGEHCPERGPALPHAHWDKCDPRKTHPGTSISHSAEMCCHCEHTAETWARSQEEELQQRLRELADPESIPAYGECGHKAYMTQPLVRDEGLEWPECSDCGAQKEPKLATGALKGPIWGRGRGWVSPRMRQRWEAIAYRVFDREGGEYYQP